MGCHNSPNFARNQGFRVMDQQTCELLSDLCGCELSEGTLGSWIELAAETLAMGETGLVSPQIVAAVLDTLKFDRDEYLRKVAE